MNSEFDFQIVVASQDICGEGPIWCARENAIYWFDINGRKIQRFEFKTGHHQVWRTDSFPTAMALRSNGNGAVVSFSDGIKLFGFDGAVQPFAHPEMDMSGNRYNEGKCDAKGRFWTGSMQSNIAADGSDKAMDRHSGGLYRIDADGSATQMLPRELGIANTMAWDRLRGVFYFGDSLAHTIYVFDFDEETGDIVNQRVFAHTPEYGVPDGSCLDTDGYLWNTRFGGNAIIRYAPDGRIDRIIDMPATNLTSACFGGDQLDTLYVTSAAAGLTDEQKHNNPFEGALIAFKPGVRGVPEFEFAG